MQLDSPSLWDNASKCLFAILAADFCKSTWVSQVGGSQHVSCLSFVLGEYLLFVLCICICGGLKLEHHMAGALQIEM